MTYPAGPSPAPPPKKQGLPPLAWVGIGCVVLLVVAGIGAMVLVNYGVRKAKQFARDVEEKPVTTLGKTIAAVNPEVEFVEADEERRRITFRNVKTGETLTFDADDVENGRISFETPEGKMTVDAEGGDEGGTVRFSTKEGTAVLRAGTEGEELPDWVVRYPGAEVSGTFSMQAGGTEGGTFGQETDDSVDEVGDFFERELKDAGFEVQVQSMSSGEARSRIIIATSEDPPRNMTVTVGTSDGHTGVAAQYGSGSR